MLAGCSGNGTGAIEDHLSEANNYDGSITDETGQSEVTIDVGGGSDGKAFDPAAVRIDAGTTVVWEWTGEGGSHNVSSVDDSDTSFRSGATTDEAGTTYEYTFDAAGTQLYVCEPHGPVGMKGGIDVVE
jgi:halocyanin-like protein